MTLKVYEGATLNLATTVVSVVTAKEQLPLPAAAQVASVQVSNTYPTPLTISADGSRVTGEPITKLPTQLLVPLGQSNPLGLDDTRWAVVSRMVLPFTW
jgi:hypothetical protein